MPQTASRLARLLGSRLVQPPHGCVADDLPAWLTLAWLRGESPGIDFNLLLRDMHHDSASRQPGRHPACPGVCPGVCL
jgi:hypothetical protein